jgi:hypothetical protein
MSFQSDPSSFRTYDDDRGLEFRRTYSNADGHETFRITMGETPVLEFTASGFDQDVGVRASSERSRANGIKVWYVFGSYESFRAVLPSLNVTGEVLIKEALMSFKDHYGMAESGFEYQVEFVGARQTPGCKALDRRWWRGLTRKRTS